MLRCDTCTHWHLKVPKVAVLCVQGCFFDISLPHADQRKLCFQIESLNDACSNAIEHIICLRDWCVIGFVMQFKARK